MTTAHEQFVDAARHGQQALTAAMQSWADGAVQLAAALPVGESRLPDPQTAVSTAFGYAEQVLTIQRTYATGLVGATTAAWDSLTAAAPARTGAKKA